MDTEYTSWPENFPETVCLVPYEELRHSTDPEIKGLYERAKNQEDREAATELINRLVSDEGIEKIKSLASRHPQAVVVSVHAVEGKGKNVIPVTLAAFIGETGNLKVDRNIVQSSIVSNTGQSTWRRLAFRSTFEGEVEPGKDYILVDDVVSAGGTFSELRHFIEKNGGKVVDTVAMANGAKSRNAVLAVTPAHILELERKYGVQLIQQFLQEEHLYGGNHKALTDAEARTLLGAKSLDEARDQIAAARQERSSRTRSEIFQGTSQNPETLNSPPFSKDKSKSRKSPQEKTGSLRDAGGRPGSAAAIPQEQNMPDGKEDASQMTPLQTREGKQPDGTYIPTKEDREFVRMREKIIPHEQKLLLAEQSAAFLERNLPGSAEAVEARRNADELRKKLGDLTALYEAETIHEEKTMSDDFDEEERFLEKAAAEEEAYERATEAVGAEENSREPMTPEERAFRVAIDQRIKIGESLKNGSLPCLPGSDGYADTTPAVNLVTGTRYHGANLLYLKDFQKRNGFPTAEYATFEAIQKSGIPIRQGERGITISYNTRNEQTKEWEHKTARLFNVAQTAKPWAFKKYAEGLAAAAEQEREEFLKTQFGDAYKPKEKAQKEPGPEISCSSTEPERYLAQYLAAVSLGGTFKASPQQAGEFAQKTGDRMYERMENGYTDPFKLSKICNEAGVQCREIIREIKEPQVKQEHTQRLEKKQSRHL
jgi:hypothetical protein